MIRTYMNTISSALLSAALVFASSMALAENQWEQKYSKEGINIFTRTVEGATLKAFKAQTVVNAPLQAVINVLGDTENYGEWSHLCNSYEFIKEPNAEGEFVSYYTINAPWPLKDRDIYVQNQISQDPNTLTVTLKVTGDATYAPEEPGYARVPEVSALWTITPIDAQTTSIEMIGHAYPGGIIPVWVANMVVTDLPKKTFKSLHRVTEIAKERMQSQWNSTGEAPVESVFPNIKFANPLIGLLAE